MGTTDRKYSGKSNRALSQAIYLYYTYPIADFARDNHLTIIVTLLALYIYLELIYAYKTKSIMAQ